MKILRSQNKKPTCKINISVPLALPNAMAKMSSHGLNKQVVLSQTHIIGCAKVWGLLCQCCCDMLRSMLHDSRLTKIKVLKRVLQPDTKIEHFKFL